jgi:hypothetical protein
MKRSIFLVVVLLMAISILPASADNGAPKGAHYTLNIHGVSNPKTTPMDGSDGHSIFVPEYGSAKIWLSSSGMSKDFQVLDANAFDGDGARFLLPLPGECYGTLNPLTGDITTPDTCTIRYTVWLRLLGKPGRSMDMYTCISDPDLAGGYMCSDPGWWVEMTRSKGKSTFTNVSKELLFVSADVDADGSTEHVQIFDPLFDAYYWQYDNQGVKLAQLRFYMGDYCVTWGATNRDSTVTPGACAVQ